MGEVEESKETTVADLELKAKAQEMGYLGKFFGDKSHSLPHLVATLLLVLYVVMGIFAFLDEGLRSTIICGIFTVTSSVLCYLAGLKIGNGKGNGR